MKLPLLCVLCQVFTRYGKCYMFNAAEEGKTLRTTMKGGTGNGLEIMLDIQQDEYLPVWGDTGRHATSPLTCLHLLDRVILPLQADRVSALNTSKVTTCSLKVNLRL